MLIVIDTNVLFSGLISPKGASFSILELAIAGEVNIAATPALWAEYEEQLSSERFVALTSLSRQDVDDILDYLASIVQRVRNDFVWRGILFDEDDAIVVESAYNASTDYLVTHNASHFVSIEDEVTFQITAPAGFLAAWRNR